MNCSRQVSEPAARLAALTTQDKYQIARLLEQAGEFENHEWTQGSKARTARGHSVPFLPEIEYGKNPPVQFCAVGHIEQVSRQNNRHGQRGILMTAALSCQVKSRSRTGTTSRTPTPARSAPPSARPPLGCTGKPLPRLSAQRPPRKRRRLPS